MADGRTIRVQGHGEVQVAADRARVMLGVRTADAGVQAAVDRNSEAVRSVMAALTGAGVPDDAIQLSQFNIFYEDHNRAYAVNNQISLQIEDVTAVGRVLAAAIRAGANATGGVSFEVKDPSDAEAEALRLAVANARSRAETLAEPLGVTVGNVVSIDAQSPGPNAYASPSMHRLARSIVAPEVPVAGGELTIAAHIQVVYEIRQRES